MWDPSLSGSGGIALDPPGGVYDSGATVGLTATPTDGWRFDHWEGDASGTSPSASVTMDANKSVTAVFVRQFKLTTAVSPAETGSVEPPGETPHDSGSSVTVVAEANDGWRFDHWEGDASGTSPSATVTMDADKSVTAVFVQRFTLTTSTTGSGSIALDPPGGIYDSGATVQVAATASDGWRFDHWEGDASGTSPSATVTMDADKSVTAVFIQRFTLTTEASPPEGGSVSPADTTTYDSGTIVSVNPEANAGWRFHHWEGDLSGDSDPANITMDANKYVKAVFIQQFQLTLIDSPQEGGTTAPENGVFDIGTEVTITATPGADYGFGYWDGDYDGTTPSATITMDANKTITAHFIRDVLIKADLSDLVPEGGNFASGLNIATIQMTVNGNPVSPEVTGTDDGVRISYTLPAEQKQASNTYTIQVMDNVGNLQTQTGGF